MWFMWPAAMFRGATAALIAVLVRGRRLLPGTYIARRAFWCPFRRTNVRVDFRRSVWDGSLLDVNACSALSLPLQCEKACLLLDKLPAIRTVAPASH